MNNDYRDLEKAKRKILTVRDDAARRPAVAKRLKAILSLPDVDDLIRVLTDGGPLPDMFIRGKIDHALGLLPRVQGDLEEKLNRWQQYCEEERPRRQLDEEEDVLMAPEPQVEEDEPVGALLPARPAQELPPGDQEGHNGISIATRRTTLPDGTVIEDMSMSIAAEGGTTVGGFRAFGPCTASLP